MKKAILTAALTLTCLTLIVSASSAHWEKDHKIKGSRITSEEIEELRAQRKKLVEVLREKKVEYFTARDFSKPPTAKQEKLRSKIEHLNMDLKLIGPNKGKVRRLASRAGYDTQHKARPHSGHRAGCEPRTGCGDCFK